MTEIQIPHVNAWKIEKHPPLEWLVIWTDLPMKPSTAGFDAEAAATPIMRLAVDTIASSEPSTAARSHAERLLRCDSGCRIGTRFTF